MPQDPLSSQPIAAAVLSTGTSPLDALKLRLAAQVAPRRWQASLNRLAKSTEDGEPLEEAIRKTLGTMPNELRSICSEALRLPAPSDFLMAVARERLRTGRYWREVRSLLAYPTVLLFCALGVGCLFSYAMLQVFDMSFFSFSYFFSSASSIAAKQDSVNRLDQHYAIVGLSISCVWLLLVALTLRWIGPAWTRLAVLGGTMVIGRPLRWLALRELLSRYDSVLSQGISGMPATEVLARSFAGSSLSMTSRVLQERLEAGAPLGRALSTSQLSDGLCRPALLMIDEHPGDPRHAIGDVSNLLEQLAQERCRTLSVVLPVFVLLIVGTILWATFSSYLSALESLMHYISALV